MNQIFILGFITSPLYDTGTTRRFTVCAQGQYLFVETHGPEQYQQSANLAQGNQVFCIARAESYRTNHGHAIKFRPYLITHQPPAPIGQFSQS